MNKKVAKCLESDLCVLILRVYSFVCMYSGKVADISGKWTMLHLFLLYLIFIYCEMMDCLKNVSLSELSSTCRSPSIWYTWSAATSCYLKQHLQFCIMSWVHLKSLKQLFSLWVVALFAALWNHSSDHPRHQTGDYQCGQPYPVQLSVQTGHLQTSSQHHQESPAWVSTALLLWLAQYLLTDFFCVCFNSFNLWKPLSILIYQLPLP